jgi:predicted cobalt transporter CbtA
MRAIAFTTVLVTLLAALGLTLLWIYGTARVPLSFRLSVR